MAGVGLGLLVVVGFAECLEVAPLVSQFGCFSPRLDVVNVGCWSWAAWGLAVWMLLAVGGSEAAPSLVGIAGVGGSFERWPA